MASPVPGNPLRRNIVAADGARYRLLEVDWMSAEPVRTVAPPVDRGDEGPIVQAALAAPQVRGLAAWIRFPASRRPRRVIACRSSTSATRGGPGTDSAPQSWNWTATCASSRASCVRSAMTDVGDLPESSEHDVEGREAPPPRAARRAKPRRVSVLSQRESCWHRPWARESEFPDARLRP